MGVARGIGILAGTVVILGAGLYGPATLLGPLPAASVSRIALDDPEPATPPVLPASGASAITLNAIDAPFAAAGNTEPMPMASITKAITALVVLDRHPLNENEPGPTVPITSDDYLSYIDYRDSGTRTVTVYTADAWTERDMLQAMLLSSSNNHADTLARWAFGSVDEYVVAANSWLAENDLADTVVVDATGLSDRSVGTAADLARLSALALETPAIASLLSEPVTGLPSRRGVDNTTTYMPENGVIGISRSYTDAAGICLQFGLDVKVEGVEGPLRVYGAFLGQPDWDTLDAGMLALVESAKAGVSARPAIAEGTPVVTLTTAWGDTARGVAGLSPDTLRWIRTTPSITVDTDPVTTAGAGATIGSILVDDGSGTERTVPLKIDSAVYDPDFFWRLGHPAIVIDAWIDSF
ncbi:D-alanyl-D-alanine carboxypeptidase family protein [Mycetocola miduiensis]|uniref:D-alanyl-D-alanine carboxypeptidase (Penicillin-binding protein 5/6) n=1 Tax=Mycetocola miduiensis TaxID=995034 RepID=A0A1I4ZSX4_9MICO|nr:serine hydrolase [Mycetocola miduiensis]SFN53267.1 D-alanyl-D-alanine carboxypeptidase (penicillin-binding protein 5/6) [Mycetocola miduiensis]